MPGYKRYYLLGLVALLALLLNSHVIAAAADPYFFPATNQSVDETMRPYWDAHGGVAMLGMPVSPSIFEVRADPFQYFERAALKFNGYDSDGKPVISSMLVGAEVLDFRYPGEVITATTQPIPGIGSYTFTETGKTVTGIFLSYWRSHGGLAQFGYPLTYPFYERSLSNGKRYIVQYFERARFEYHPEQANPRSQVMLGLVGREAYQQYLNPKPAEKCSYGLNQSFGNSLRDYPDMLQKQGCPIEPGTSYDQIEGGGYQHFVNADVIINIPVAGPPYAYVLYPNNTFHRFDYQGSDPEGGDQPLPGVHFFKVALQAGNLGASQGSEVWNMKASQHFEHGILFYIPGSAVNDVFSIMPNNSETGTWMSGGAPVFPVTGP